jgi:hypothetical protein
MTAEPEHLRVIRKYESFIKQHQGFIDAFRKEIAELRAQTKEREQG